MALKVLEPVDPRSTSTISTMTNSQVGVGNNGSAQAAFEAFRLKWENDTLENAARSYCTARQELNMLLGIKHPHITSLFGFSVFPTTLIVELAPYGALNSILAKYRKYNTRLHMNVLQQTCVQVF